MKSALLPVLGLVFAAAPLAAQYPTKPPAPLPLRPAHFPPFQTATLPNGLRMIVVENHKEPVLSISLDFPAGSAVDPRGKEGLADFVAGLLTKGAGKRTAEEISATIEGVGGSLAASAGRDFLTIGADVLSEDATLAFDLIADAAIRPTFPDKEMDLLRTQTLSGLQLELSQPASIASRRFAAELYGDTPYGRNPLPESVKALTRDDLTAFQQAHLRPGGALLVIAGDITLAKAKALATAAFAGWTGTAAPVAKVPPPPARAKTEIVLINRPGSVQSNILVGNATYGPVYPEMYAATVANRVLGEGADSRLFDILREKKSWTYGAYSSLRRYKGTGYFVANTEVRTEVTDSALTELLHQLTRIGTEAVPPVELGAAKSSLVGRFPLTVETAAQVASNVANVQLYGLGPDYLQNYRTRLSAVTSGQVMAAAKKVIRADRMLVVVVGDGAKLYGPLKAIAPVRIESTEGAPLTPDDLVAKVAALDLDHTQLVARHDSFTVMVQGNPFGYRREGLEPSGDGWKFTEDVQIPAAGFQSSTELTFTSDLTAQNLTVSGSVQGQPRKAEAAFTATHVKGTATTPSQAGPKTVSFDTTIAAGTVDDNLIFAVLPAIKWADGAKITVNTFQTDKGVSRPVTMAVGGKESITVPAGTFDVWKVDVSLDQPAVFYVSTAAPHRLVKFTVVGAPIEFLLVK
jgi:zinc protease